MLALVLWNLGWLAAQAGPVADEQVAVWFEAAREAKAAGNLELAVSEYRKVIRARPGLAEARSNLGVVQYMRGRCGDAVAEFRQALRVQPEMEIPLLFSGICYQKMHRYEQAVPLLERALQSPARHSEAYLYLALSYSGLGDEVRAGKWFEKFAAANPKDLEALYQLGGSYLRLSKQNLTAAGTDRFLFARTQAELGDLQNRPVAKVRARYEEAIALRPGYPNLHWLLARVLLRGDEIEEGRAALEQELRIQPEHLPALLLAGELDRRAGAAAREREEMSRMAAIAVGFPRDDRAFARLMAEHPARAISLLNVLLEVGELPKETVSKYSGWPAPAQLDETLRRLRESVVNGKVADWPLEVYVRARIARGDLQAARGELEDMARRRPTWDMPRYLLGAVYHQLSLVTYIRMAEADPEGYRTLLLKAETLENGNYDEEAEQAYRAVLNAQPDAGGVHFRLGALLLRKRQLSQAEEELTKELALDPYSTPARVALAEAYTEQRKAEKAVPLLERAIEEDPRLTSALLALARVYLMQGKAAQAAQLFERALKLDPEDGNAHYQLAQTYQDLGRDKDAEREFEAVRRIRARGRASRPASRPPE